MNRIITDPSVRQKVYAVMTALVPILVGYGLISDADASKYVALIGALGGALTTIMAALNTSSPAPSQGGDQNGTLIGVLPHDIDPGIKYVPRHDATSDTKADAAGL